MMQLNLLLSHSGSRGTAQLLVLISIIANPGAAVMFRQGGFNSGTIPVFILKLLVLYHMPFALKSEGLYR